MLVNDGTAISRAASSAVKRNTTGSTCSVYRGDKNHDERLPGTLPPLPYRLATSDSRLPCRHNRLEEPALFWLVPMDTGQGEPRVP